MSNIYVNGEGVPKMKPGEWAWVVKKKGEDPFQIAYGCPCGTECRPFPVNCYIPVDRVKHDKAWAWDGNWDEPTLTPSILRGDGCHWHGYLRKGKFVQV